ncbi:MAG: phage virion morphogenesis protein [Magnetococcales bacterium]|nr:phage virion morphogenesis protein [Magnetococcales bacterium]MBF0322731.1 phage virion morphogenesis protein [Magnetococcales bacterium]
MSGATLDIQIDDRSALAMLAGLQARAADLTPAMQAIGEHIIETTQVRFDAQVAPDGTAWQPDNPGYWASKKIKKVLTESSRLRGSVVYKAGRDQVVVGTNVLYAAVHQFGATIVPVQAKRLRFQIGSHVVYAKKVTIPARPFLGVNDTDQKAIMATIQDFLLGATA